MSVEKLLNKNRTSQAEAISEGFNLVSSDSDRSLSVRENASESSRNEKIFRFWRKKYSRGSQKIVRYSCRQNLAN